MPARTIYLIKRLEVASRVLLETELKDLDLTPSQYTTLSMLGTTSEASSSDLARRVLVTPKSMSEMIMSLDRKGLIKRKENETNRRVLGISLSPAGRALLEKAEHRVDALEARLFSSLTPSGLLAMREALGTVLKHDPATVLRPAGPASS
jgi:DNA-binding MarR family transcriptional regulator